ncbi:MAG: ATP-binding cassette domain-containing protein [Bdellovibrionales bacterium]|nr:ATP-binding cassette domain-containing protein [Bdellovibrionales bacterium]
MIVLENIEKSFQDLHVLRGVSLQLEPGKIYGLIGPSGGGKSVLLKIIAGVLEAEAGTRDVDGIPDEEISIMFQEGALFDSMNVMDNVAFPLLDGRVPTTRLSNASYAQVYPKVEAILEQVGLKDALFKVPAQLSGGMRRRVSLARALVTEPKLLLLDDPTAGLDPVASSVIMELIAEIFSQYKPITLIVSHDLRRLFKVVQDVYALFGGLPTFHGSVAQLDQAPKEVQQFVSCRYELAA